MTADVGHPGRIAAASSTGGAAYLLGTILPVVGTLFKRRWLPLNSALGSLGIYT